MASMRDIKRRRSSISSTQQITKAMKLVSTVKLQKAKGRAEQTAPYFNYMYDTVCTMLAKAGSVNHPYLNKQESTKKAVITISSNRGLAGGYNSNVVKLLTQGDFPAEDVEVYAIGHKAEEGLSIRGYHVAKEYNEVMEAPTYEDAMAIRDSVISRYSHDVYFVNREGAYDEWRQRVDQLLDTYKDYATTPEEVQRIVFDKPLDKKLKLAKYLMPSWFAKQKQSEMKQNEE